MSSAAPKPASRTAARTTARPTSGFPAGPSARPPQSPHKRVLILIAVGVAMTMVAGGLWLAIRSADSSATGGSGAYVGGDLHTITAIDGRIYVGGHDGVAISRDDAKSWSPVPTLRGADAMGWAATSGTILVGGHPGLFRSTDGGATFTKTAGPSQVSDVHALGAAGASVYLASPQAGLFTSVDGGNTWQLRNSDVGRSFMGTILVDPKDPSRLIAPDMRFGLVTSVDGGVTWTSLGGPGGAMAAAWDPTDTQRLAAVGMGGGATSDDGGHSWNAVTLPEGTSAVTFSEDGKTLYAAALDGEDARTFSSTDFGATWVAN